MPYLQFCYSPSAEVKFVAICITLYNFIIALTIFANSKFN